MISVPTTDNSFQMTGARQIIDRAGGAIQIRQQVEAIERAISDQPALVFDLAKALLETVCKTILDERKISHESGWDTPRLLKETLAHLQLFPDGHGSPSEVTESMKKTVNGLLTTVHGLCDLRTREGIASHGREAYSINLEPIQALLAANAADTVASFLWNVHRSYSPVGGIERLSYGDHPEFNENLDQIHEPPVKIFEETYLQSEVLFTLDREAYRDALKEYSTNMNSAEQDIQEPDIPEQSRHQLNQ